MAYCRIWHPIGHTLREDEYRSLQLELFQRPEEEIDWRTKREKESASFPLTHEKRKFEDKNLAHVQWKTSGNRSPNQEKTDLEEEESVWGVQQKVHALEHAYNQECFLKVHT